MNPSSVRFGGVRIWQTGASRLAPVPRGQEQWGFELVKDDHPELAKDQVEFRVHDTRSLRSASWTTVTLRSARVAEELTGPFSAGRLTDNREFAARLLRILQDGAYTAESGKYSSYYDGGPGRVSRHKGSYDASGAKREFTLYLPAVAHALRKVAGGGSELKGSDEAVVTAERRKYSGLKGFFNRTKETVETYRGPRLFASARSNVKLPYYS